MKKKKLRLKKKYRLLCINFALFMFVVLFVGSFYRVMSFFYYDKKTASLQEAVIEDVLHYEVLDGEEIIESVDFELLEQFNDDVIAWISIPKTNINYPVVQGSDNTYYLSHDIEKKYNIYGSIYMNYQNHSDFSDANTILFGHNTYKDSMFSDLVKIYNGEYGQDLSIFIYTREETREYSIYAAYVTDDMDEKPLNIQTSFFERNEVDFGIHEKGTHTLTLSTCFRDDEKRVVIHAVLKEEESKADLTP